MRHSLSIWASRKSPGVKSQVSLISLEASLKSQVNTSKSQASRKSQNSDSSCQPYFTIVSPDS